MAVVLTVLAAVILLMVYYSRDFLVVDIHSKRERTLTLSHGSNTLVPVPDEVNTDLENHKRRKITLASKLVKEKEPAHTKTKELPVHTLVQESISKTSSHRGNTPDELKTKSVLHKSRTVATDKLKVKEPARTKIKELPAHTQNLESVSKTSLDRNTPVEVKTKLELHKNRKVATDKLKVKEPTSTKTKELPVHTLKSMRKNCSDTLCLKHLSGKERGYFDECTQRTIAFEYKFGPITNSGQCRFQNGTGRVPVALASFPGSGNTWVRGLLEKVTGFCTGNYNHWPGLTTA